MALLRYDVAQDCWPQASQTLGKIWKVDESWRPWCSHHDSMIKDHKGLQIPTQNIMRFFEGVVQSSTFRFLINFMHSCWLELLCVTPDSSTESGRELHDLLMFGCCSADSWVFSLHIRVGIHSWFQKGHNERQLVCPFQCIEAVFFWPMPGQFNTSIPILPLESRGSSWRIPGSSCWSRWPSWWLLGRKMTQTDKLFTKICAGGSNFF